MEFLLQKKKSSPILLFFVSYTLQNTNWNSITSKTEGCSNAANLVKIMSQYVAQMQKWEEED